MDLATIVRDPVCGMEVDPYTSSHYLDHNGHRFHFCAAHCHDKFRDHPEEFISAKDPVCGMQVERASAVHMAKHAGVREYFCSDRCKTKFEAEPEAYLGDRPAPEPMPEGTQYTCPMDPEIIEDEPGDCPICGMALEPMTPSLNLQELCVLWAMTQSGTKTIKGSSSNHLMLSLRQKGEI